MTMKMSLGRTVEIEVSDPWEFYDENGGEISFRGKIISIANDRYWVVRLERAATACGRQWRYAIAMTRHEGQKYFDDPGESDRAANLHFIDEQQARSPDWLSTVGSSTKSDIAFGIGTCRLL